MTIKSRFILIIFIALLTACGITPTQPIATAAATPTTQPPTPLPTFTPDVGMPIAFPTLPNLPIPTVMPTRMPLPAILPKFPLTGYVMLFTKDGDLYFQDGESTPVKLTHVGKKAPFRILSDDNKKVVFTRDNSNSIYSINTDGSQEHIVIPNSWPNLLKPGTQRGGMDFVPNTHQLFLQAVLCESPEFRSLCSTSIFLADTDAGDIKKIADLGLTQQKDRIPRSIKVSPDGKMVAVGTIDGVNILNMDGKVIRNNILPYKPSQKAVLLPSLFWLPDSKGLIAAPPDTIYHSTADGDLPAHTIWRYVIESNASSQIPFKPPPMLETFQISPDGNWIIYGGLSNDNSVYLGNLLNGYTQGFGYAQQSSFSWSPGSKYFIYTDLQSTLGTIDSPPVLTPTCYLVQWIDAGHFTCDSIENKGFRIRMAKITGEGVVKIYDLGFGKDIENSVFIKPK
jgi:hypothetical protein